MEQMSININRTPSFTEVWYEGSVEHNGEFHRFWLVDPEGSDYEMEVRWFNKSVPREVRAVYVEIINTFKQIQDDRRKNEDRNNLSIY